MRPFFSHPTEAELKKKAVVQRMDSKIIESRYSASGRSSILKSRGNLETFETIQMSPTSYAKLQDEGDHVSLLEKQDQEEHLEAVNLN